MAVYATLDYKEGGIKTFKAIHSAHTCETKFGTGKPPCKVIQGILELFVSSEMQVMPCLSLIKCACRWRGTEQ